MPADTTHCKWMDWSQTCCRCGWGECLCRPGNLQLCWQIKKKSMGFLSGRTFMGLFLQICSCCFMQNLFPTLVGAQLQDINLWRLTLSVKPPGMKLFWKKSVFRPCHCNVYCFSLFHSSNYSLRLFSPVVAVSNAIFKHSVKKSQQQQQSGSASPSHSRPPTKHVKLISIRWKI